jgi:hypothetical protein
VYTRSAGVWRQEGPKLVGTGAIGPYGGAQGISVSLTVIKALSESTPASIPLDEVLQLFAPSGVVKLADDLVMHIDYVG